MTTNNIFQQNNTKPSEKTELPPVIIPAYPKTAKFKRDSHPNRRRQLRPHAGGFFSLVEYVTCGFMPGVRGLQDGENRNKRVEFLRLDEKTWQFLRSLKIKVGVVMTTNTWTSLVQNILARLPKRAIRNIPPKKTKPATGSLTFQSTNTSLIAYYGDDPVAWIYPGIHTGQIDKKKISTMFWDVAYHKQNSRGRYLETDSFDTGAEAIDFISTFFNFGGAAQ